MADAATTPAVGQTIEYRELGRYLPHRFPFIMIDRITAWAPDAWIRGVKNLAPHEPLLPGADGAVARGLLVEAVGQLCIALVNLSAGRARPREILLGAIADLVFHERVRTGSRVELEARLENAIDDALVFSGTATLSGRPVLTLGSMIVTARRDLAAPRG